MSISPIIDSPVDVDGINSIRMNLNEDFTELYDEKNNALSETLPVFIRIRPMLPQEDSLGYNNCLTIFENSVVRATAPVDSAKFRNMDKIQDFTFTHVFGSDVSQLLLFEETMNSAVKGFIEGQNTLLFAYGSSGSGKTYTILGNEKEPGLIPLTIQLFFQCVQEKQVPSVSFRPHNACEVISLDPSEIAEQCVEKEKLLMSFNEDMDYTKASCSSMAGFDVTRISDSVLQDLSTLPSFAQLESSCRSFLEFQGDCYYSCWVSFLELYNEQIYDLFKPFTKKKRQALGLAEDQNGNIFVKGLKEIHVSSISEVLKLLRLGKRNLNIATTKLNYQSSRSHCIFNIKVIRVSDLKSPSKVFVNTLSFCDLAGSERCGKTQNTGMRLKEASNINASLMVLGRCIELLRQNQTLKEKKLIPFRESKLTRLFSSYFIGKGKALMIVNVSPSSHTFDETSNVLKFSALAQQVTMKEGFYVSRITDLIACDRFSSSSNRESMDEEFDYSMFEEKDAIIKELVELAQSLETQLNEEKAAKAEVEAKVHSELRGEFMEYFSECRNNYKKILEDMRKNDQRKTDRRVKALFQALHPDSTKDSSSSEEDEGDDFLDSDSELAGDENERESNCDKVKDIEISPIDQVEQEILALRAKLKEQEIKLAASERSLNEANGTLSLKDEIIEQCNLQMSEFKETISMLEESVNTKTTQVEKLHGVVSEKTVKLETAERECIDLQETLTATKNELTTMQNEEEIETFKLRITELEENLTQQENFISNQRNTVRDLEASVANAQNNMNENAKKAADLEQYIKVLKEQLMEQAHLSQKREENVNTQVTELKTKDETIKTCFEKINSLEQKICKKENLAEDIKSEMAAKSVELSKLEEQCKELQSVIRTKENQLKKSNLPCKSASQQTDPMNYEAQISDLRETLSVMEEKMKEKENHLNQLNSEMTEKSQKLLKLEEMHVEWQTVLQKKVEKLIKIENLLSQLKPEIDAKSQKILKLEAQCSQWQSVIQTKESELQSKDNIIKQVKEELTSNNDSLIKEKENNCKLQKSICLKDAQLKEKEETMKTASKGFSSQADELSKKCSELQEIVSSKENELQKQITIVNELNSQNQSLNAVVSEHETNLSKTAEILLQKQNKIEVLSEKISQLEAEKEMMSVIEPIPNESEKLNEPKPEQSLEETAEKRAMMLDDDDDDDEIEDISTSDLQELVNLLQKIECVSTKKWEGVMEVRDKAIKRIHQLIMRNCKLISDQNELNSKLQNCDRMIADKDSSIKDLEKALKDQKEIEQAEREMCKNKYEIEIEKLKTLTENYEKENKNLKEEKLKAKQYEAELKKLKTIKEIPGSESNKLKQELKSKHITELEGLNTEKETSEKEEMKSKEKPESEKEQFLKPKLGRTRRAKNSLEIQSGAVESTSSDLKETRSRRNSSNVKNNVARIPSPKEISPPRASQRRKKASRDVSKDSLSNGDSETKTESSENASPKPKLRAKQRSSSVDPKSDVDETPLPKPRQNKQRKKILSFEQSKDNSDADFEPPTKIVSSRATRSSSIALTEELKKSVRPTRVTRKKSMINQDEELKAAPITKTTRGKSSEEPKKARINESPLHRIKNFVSEAVPKIKLAAEHVSSMLSPATTRKEIPPPVSTRRKRKLFTDDCQPILAAVSPMQKEKEKEPVERRTRARQSKRAKK